MNLRVTILKSMMHRPSTPAGVTLLYAVFAAVCIVLSGYVLTVTVADPLLQKRIELATALVFVVVTSGLLYLLLKRWQETAGGAPSVTARAFVRPKSLPLLITLILLVLVVPVLDVTVFELRVAQEENDAYGNLGAVAALKSGQIEYWLKERRGDALELAANSGFALQIQDILSRKPDAGERRELLTEIESFRVNHGFDSIMIFASDGRLLSSAGSDTETPPQNLMSQALSGNRVLFSDLYRDPAGIINLDWIVPIIATRHQTHRAVAIAVLRVVPDKFLYKLIQTWPTVSDSGESLLVRSEGGAILFLNDLRFQRNAALNLHLDSARSDLPAAIAIRNNKPGTTAGLDYRRVPVLAAYRPVAGSGWFLIAKLDRDEVIKPVRLLIYWVSGVSAIGVFMVMAMLMILLRQQQRAQRMALQARSIEVLQQSERRFRAVARSAMDAIVTADSSGNVMDVNPSAEKMFGYPEAEMMGRPLTGLMPERYRDLHRAGLNRVVAGGEMHVIGKTMELAGLRKDGSEFPLELSLAKWEIVDGQYFTAVIRDMTERKHEQEKLQASEIRYRRLFESAKDGILILDAETGAVVDANPFIVEMMGYSRKELLGRKIWELGFYKDLLASKLNFTELQQKEYLRYEDLPLETADGNMYHVEFVSNTYLVGNEKVIQCNIRDITSRKTSELKIRRLTQFYAALSHCNETIVRSKDEAELFRDGVPLDSGFRRHEDGLDRIGGRGEQAGHARCVLWRHHRISGRHRDFGGWQ